MVCIALRTGDCDDGVKQAIAKKLIALSKAGERNPDILCEEALKDIRRPQQWAASEAVRSSVLADAVRTPQAHPETRPPQAARTMRRPRRVPPRSHRPEPQENGEAHAGRGTAAGGLTRFDPIQRCSVSTAARSNADFFNAIDQRY